MRKQRIDMEKRIVCWFSCGAASAVATKLAIVENAGRLPLVVARCIVREEHPDNDRFAADCEKWFGVPITNLMNEKYNGSIIEAFSKNRFIASFAGAVCTKYLKKEVTNAFLMPGDLQVWGFTVEEEHRLDRVLDAQNNFRVWPVLIDRGLEHKDCLAMVENAGIQLPEMYRLGYKHNNCIGCVKAGAGYWNKIRNDFPEQFRRMADLEQSLNVKLLKTTAGRISLHELKPGTGAYQEEPEIQCGIFCEMAQRELVAA